MNNDRLKRAHKIVEQNEIDGLIIYSQENIQYLSGFSGSAGALVLTNDSRYLLTDSRYTTEAKLKVSNFNILEYKDQFKCISSLAQRLQLRRVGLEVAAVNYELFLKLRRSLKGCKLIPTLDPFSELRIKKEPQEVSLIKKAIRIAEKSYNEIATKIKRGKKERDLAIDLEYRMRQHGSDGVPFDTIIASGSRSAMPHAKAGRRAFKKGDFVVIDFGCRYNGYNSDETCTLFMGRPTKKHVDIYKTVKEAHDVALSNIKPGVRAKDIDKKARSYIRRAGYGDYFGHGLGHGVGLAVHEEPRISPMSEAIIKEGFVFTVEPGVYIPGWGGVRLEDMVCVTKTGCEVLTKISKEMRII